MKDLGLAVDYKPSEGELDNFLYLTFKYTINWGMRQADKAICLMLADDVVGQKGLERLLKVTAEYIWDHLMGEPPETKPEDLITHMEPLLEQWYAATTAEERADTN